MEQQSRLVRIVPIDQSETNRALVQVVLNSEMQEMEPVTTKVDYLDSVLSGIKRSAIRKAYKEVFLSSKPIQTNWKITSDEQLEVKKKNFKSNAKIDTGESTKKEPLIKMSELSREELNAKLEAVEARMDARVVSIESKIDAFLAGQAERDKRMEDISTRATKAAESAATVKSNYWAAVIVQLLAVVAIVVGAYFALHQSNQSVAQTVQSTYQMGREDGRKEYSKPPVIPTNK